jgi:ABC-2 type transport system ATP-binding protein
VIQLQELTMSYGEVEALRGVSLEVGGGELVGLIGPNGAGKTTAMKILATLLLPTGGDALVDGHSVRAAPRTVRSLIGYMPDFFGVYRDMRVREYLAFFAAAYGMPRADRPRIVADLLELVDLGHKADALIDTLSRGMQQRLGLARVLVHDPRVLILDEPASGLDPRARIDIREILKELRRMGKTILLSSHILPELGDLCTQLAIMTRGQLVAYGTLAQLRERAGVAPGVELEVDDVERARVLLQGHPAAVSVTALENGRLAVALAEGSTAADVAQVVVAGGLRLSHLGAQLPSLEDIFLRLTQEGGAADPAAGAGASSEAA